MAAVEARAPAVALIDIRMPAVGGIEVARRIARTAPKTAVVLFTGFGERALLTEALDADVRGFVLKEAPLSDLARAVQLVAEGGVYVDAALSGALIGSAAADVPALSQRERQVLRFLADGLTTKEIAGELFISPETVRTYVRKAMVKLNADTRTQAVASALRQSLIS